jgi:hypothetical protein
MIVRTRRTWGTGRRNPGLAGEVPVRGVRPAENPSSGAVRVGIHA